MFHLLAVWVILLVCFPQQYYQSYGGEHTKVWDLVWRGKKLCFGSVSFKSAVRACLYLCFWSTLLFRASKIRKWHKSNCEFLLTDPRLEVTILLNTYVMLGEGDLRKRYHYFSRKKRSSLPTPMNVSTPYRVRLNGAFHMISNWQQI